MSNSIIYFVQAGEFIKIGTTHNLKKRLAAISTYSPFPVHLLHTLPGGWRTEVRIHQRFSGRRAHKEWFKDCPEIRQYIESNCMDDVAEDIHRRDMYGSNVNHDCPEWLSSLLEDHNIDLDRIKEITGLSPSTVCRWASTNHRAAVIEGKVAKVLGMSPQEFLALRTVGVGGRDAPAELHGAGRGEVAVITLSTPP